LILAEKQEKAQKEQQAQQQAQMGAGMFGQPGAGGPLEGEQPEGGGEGGPPEETEGGGPAEETGELGKSGDFYSWDEWQEKFLARTREKEEAIR
jgi:hypothetical protein